MEIILFSRVDRVAEGWGIQGGITGLKRILNQVWWHTTIIPALAKESQAYLYEFKSSPFYIVSYKLV